MKLIFEKPTPQTPGYLRREKRRLAFIEAQEKLTGVDKFSSMVEFLLDFIKEPADKDEAREVLLDASQEEIDELYDFIAGKDTVPPATGES